MTEYEGRGGAQISIWYLMRSLVSAGHSCVLVGTGSSRGMQVGEIDGIRVYEVGIRNIYWPYDRGEQPPLKRLAWHAIDSWNIAMQTPLHAICKLESPDVVSLHNLPGWSASVWSTLSSLKIPAVQVLHDLYLLCSRTTMFRDGHNCGTQCTACRLLRLPHARASRQLTAVVGVSQFILERHQLAGYFQGVSLQRVIHDARDSATLGIDESTANQVPVAHDAASSPALTFGFIGRLEVPKGIELLLQAFGELRSPDVRLLIAGTGKSGYESTLKAQTNDRRVTFLGRVAPREFYPQIDALVLPSLWEDTFPGVAFEALAFGRPVIGSRRGGIPEIVKDNVQGLLFEPDRPGELNRLLDRLIAEPALRHRLTEGARAGGRGFLDTHAWVKAYLSVYKSAASHRADSSSGTLL